MHRNIDGLKRNYNNNNAQQERKKIYTPHDAAYYRKWEAESKQTFGHQRNNQCECNRCHRMSKIGSNSKDSTTFRHTHIRTYGRISNNQAMVEMVIDGQLRAIFWWHWNIQFPMSWLVKRNRKITIQTDYLQTLSDSQVYFVRSKVGAVQVTTNSVQTVWFWLHCNDNSHENPVNVW